MKNKITDNFRFVVMLLSILTGILAVSKVFAALPRFTATVTYISDGDTIKIEPATPSAHPNPKNPNDPQLTIRMVGMDAPELHVPNPQGKFQGQSPYGEKAKAALVSLIPVGTKVMIEDHGQDVYGRTLARILVAKQDINLEMVRLGWAMPYNICTGTEDCNSTYAQRHKIAEYFDACNYSREYGLGMYDPKAPLTELPFEFRMRVQERPQVRFPGSFKNKTYLNPTDYKKVDICDLIFFQTEADAKRIGYVNSN